MTRKIPPAQVSRTRATRVFNERRRLVEGAEKAARLEKAVRADRTAEHLMTLHGSNFHGMRILLPLIETLAYISLDVAWPKKKEAL